MGDKEEIRALKAEIHELKMALKRISIACLDKSDELKREKPEDLAEFAVLRGDISAYHAIGHALYMLDHPNHKVTQAG
ncbi:hypothetical protein ABZ488_07510 [Streptomyces griseus]|uniref:hypothetical protein n=1 Tax=Streptomyces griseus TaxID=1911 RepID=UPI0034082A39